MRWVAFLLVLFACKNVEATKPPKTTKRTKTIEKAKPRPPRKGGPKSPIGTNLDMLRFASTDWPFLNAVRMGDGFRSGTVQVWQDGRDIPSDKNGWPTKLEANQRAKMIIPSQEGGKMAVRWKGSGSIEIAGTEKPIRNLRRVGERRFEFEADPNQDLLLAINDTDAKDHVRDIEVFTRKYEKRLGEIFHPKFVERLRPFGLLRFMDWGRTNGSRLSEWKYRTTPDFYVQGRATGVAYEHMIALANRVHADPWINIPHLANDEFVESLAKLLKAKLDPELVVHVEWSNEVWNNLPAFTQGQHAQELGMRLGLDPTPDVARLKFQAKRSVDVFRIFERVFGDKKRVFRIIGSQVGNHYAHEALFQAAKGELDAIAIAPYFGAEIATHHLHREVKKHDVEWLMKRLERKSLPIATEAIDLTTGWAKKRGVVAIAYEGGQHLVCEPGLHDDKPLNDLLDQANRHPAMKKIYLLLLNHWKKAGGTAFVHFTFAAVMEKWGRFGSLESLDQKREDAPKYDALLEFAEKNERWW